MRSFNYEITQHVFIHEDQSQGSITNIIDHAIMKTDRLTMQLCDHSITKSRNMYSFMKINHKDQSITNIIDRTIMKTNYAIMQSYSHTFVKINHKDQSITNVIDHTIMKTEPCNGPTTVQLCDLPITKSRKMQSYIHEDQSQDQSITNIIYHAIMKTDHATVRSFNNMQSCIHDD
eukprot:TRINITY_DN220_c0_g1_i1.p1 TRINITY_DN220_c0_g1~~TRINITY_DN220_c0_g1_i1.p1  ORF type:complete len:175 (+),score=13.33 TRINITY_DN220_c0_g1_i1:2156-2680(+)